MTLFFNDVNDHMAYEVNTIFLHGSRVRLKVSPDRSFSYVAYIVYKWQGRGHYKMKIRRNSMILEADVNRCVLRVTGVFSHNRQSQIA